MASNTYPAITSVTEIYILYGALFVVIFLGLLFSLAKGLGGSKNFPKPKEKKNADNKKEDF